MTGVTTALSPEPQQKGSGQDNLGLFLCWLPEQPLAPCLPLQTLTRALGHTNFHHSIYLVTRERKGLGFGLARGVPCTPRFLFGLASAWQTGLHLFPAAVNLLTMDSLDSDSRPSMGFWDWATDRGNFSHETPRKENLRLCDAQRSQCPGQMLSQRTPQSSGLLGNMQDSPVGAGRLEFLRKPKYRLCLS